MKSSGVLCVSVPLWHPLIVGSFGCGGGRAVPLWLLVSPGLFPDGQKAFESRQELFGAFLVRQMAAMLEHDDSGVA